MCDRHVYSLREKLLLLNLLEPKKHIIECKKRDGDTIITKQEAWKKICDKYNSNDVPKRTVKQLKKLWNNLKQKYTLCFLNLLNV